MSLDTPSILLYKLHSPLKHW